MWKEKGSKHPQRQRPVSLGQNTVTEPTSSERNYFAISKAIKFAVCVGGCTHRAGRGSGGRQGQLSLHGAEQLHV